MKKLLFVFPIVALLAAGCNSPKQAQVQPTQNQAVSQQAKKQPAPTLQTPPQATPTNATASWETYTDNSGYYQVKYPAGWGVADLTYSYQGKTNVAFRVSGPWRNNLPGATDKAQFDELFGYDSTQNKFTDSGELSFDYPGKPGDQAVNSVALDVSYIKSTPDYQTAQVILSTAKILKTPTVNWETMGLPNWNSVSFSYPSNWTVSVTDKNNLELSNNGQKINIFYDSDSGLTGNSSATQSDFEKVMSTYINSYGSRLVNGYYDVALNSSPVGKYEFQINTNVGTELHEAFFVGTLLIDVYTQSADGTIYSGVYESFK